MDGQVDKRTLKKHTKNRTRASLNRVQRVIKVVVPRCVDGECQEEFGWGWWEKCDHNPWASAEDGQPHLKQVAFEMKINSNSGLDRAIRKGGRLPEDVGLKPYCQYRDCWSQDVKYKTRWGDYCSRDHAALVILREEEQVVWAPFDEDSRRRRAQIDNVQID